MEIEKKIRKNNNLIALSCDNFIALLEHQHALKAASWDMFFFNSDSDESKAHASHHKNRIRRNFHVGSYEAFEKLKKKFFFPIQIRQAERIYELCKLSE